MGWVYENDADYIGVKDGPGSAAEFYAPQGLDWSPDGTMIVVAEYGNQAVRLITYPGLVVSTLAGSGTYAGQGHVDAVGRDARFNIPSSASFSPDSKYVVLSDLNNDQIRKIEVATGVVTTLTGFTTGADGVLDGPRGLHWHPSDPTKVLVTNHYRDNILILTCAELVPPPPPTGSPTPGPTSNPTPVPTTNPSPGPTASPSPEPTPGPTSQIDVLEDKMDSLEDKMDSVLAALLDMKDLLNQRDQAPVCYGRRSQTKP
jgi:DNA-binding beta-propeller fold protein YncE